MRSVWICLDVGWGQQTPSEFLLWWGCGAFWGDRLPHEEVATNSKRILPAVGVGGSLGETGCLVRSVWICLDVGLGQQTPREFLLW